MLKRKDTQLTMLRLTRGMATAALCAFTMSNAYGFTRSWGSTGLIDELMQRMSCRAHAVERRMAAGAHYAWRIVTGHAMK